MNPNQTTANANPGAMGTIEATFTFPEVTNLIQKMFVDKLENVPIDAMPLFIEKSVPQGQGDSIQVNEKDFTTYANNMPEGSDAKKGIFGVGYHKQVLWHRYGQEYDITYKMRTTAQWLDVVQSTVEALSVAPTQRINLDATHMLTFGNAVSYVDLDGTVRDTSTGDGLALFSAVHTLAFNANTYSNIVPGAPQFDKTALEAAELLAVTNIRDNFGVKKVMNFTHIITSDAPSVCNDVMQLLRSISDPNQANSGTMNPYKARYSHLKLSLLATDANGNPDATKQNWWGIAALEGTGGSRWQAYKVTWEPVRMKTMPTMGNNGEDVHNDNWTYGARAACNFASLSGRGIIFSLAPQI